MEIHPVINTCELSRHAQCWNVLKNTLSPIVQRMKKAAKEKQSRRLNEEKD